MAYEREDFENAANGVIAAPVAEDARVSVRQAARQRIPLDGADAQALEGALAQAEKEVTALTQQVEQLKREKS